MRRRVDLKTGTTCNSNCVFCVIGDHLFTGDRSTEACIEELRTARATSDDVVFTGAEVSIRQDFFKLVAVAKRLGYQRIQVQTNGRMFAYREFAERAVAAGMNEFAPAVHGHIAKLHDGLTRAPGSFVQIMTAVDHMAALGVPIVSNTVVTKQNMRHMSALVELLLDHGVGQIQLAFPHPTGHAARHFDGVVPRMSEAAPHIHAALDIAAARGVLAMAEAMPFCTMHGHEAQVAELHIPPTEIVYDGYVVPDYQADRIARGKLRFGQCATCRFEPICEGPWREYPERRGSDEFVPRPGARIVDRGSVLDGRWTMIGEPAPTPVPGGGWRVVAFVPAAGSPSCTRELQALGRARDVATVVVSPDPGDRLAWWAEQHAAAAVTIADIDRAIARAWRALDDHGGVRRSSYLVDPDGNVAHVVVDVDPDTHDRQIAEALARLHAPPRALAPVDDLVTLRRPTRARSVRETDEAAP
jgi:MoaA/NifB/PqqE/SkfB family radical SAM enzyme/peroxiredoxin